jgi:hypothetical protein
MDIKRLALALFIIFLTNSQVDAATISWNYSGGGSWNTSTNWTPSRVPDAGDDAVINIASAGTITVDSNSIVNTLTLSGGCKIVLSADKLYISSGPLRVFVTSATGQGNLSTWADAGGQTGLAAGDAVCQAAADNAGLPGTFKAWLSDDTSDAYCRVHNLTGRKSANCGQPSLPTSAGPWVRTDGFPFGGPIQNILSPYGIVYAPVRYDEFGDAVTGSFYYFTNTGVTGELASSSPCTNWTTSGTNFVLFGEAEETVYDWTDSLANRVNANFCSYSRHLLCFQTGSGPALPGHSSTGKKIFVTSVSGSGNLYTWADSGGLTGIAAGNHICQARASAAGFANAAHFKAWLSDSTIDARDRITSDGPWVRLDGVKVADNKADLIDGKLFTAISMTETNVYGGYLAFTGTYNTGTKAFSHCSNWTSSVSTDDGYRGLASDAGNNWSYFDSYHACGITSSRLYCIEDE